MKEPDIKQCPACGVELFYSSGSLGTVVPECEQTHDAEGKLIYVKLYWRCLICGCRWRHGQFAEQQDKG